MGNESDNCLIQLAVQCVKHTQHAEHTLSRGILEDDPTGNFRKCKLSEINIGNNFNTSLFQLFTMFIIISIVSQQCNNKMTPLLPISYSCHINYEVLKFYLKNRKGR